VEAGYERRIHMLGLDTAERGEILQALVVDCPAGLGDLRTVLLQEQEWRDREGLS
jgi:Mrp family chromosome partitioning ATPase